MINYDTYKEIQNIIKAGVKFYKICETLKITKTQFVRYGQMPKDIFLKTLQSRIDYRFETYRDFIISILKVTPDINDTAVLYSVKEVFEMVQQEIKKRTKGGKRYSGVGIFGSKIKCGECGGWFGAKVWHSTDKYKKTVYRCNNKYGDKKVCETPHLTEEEIKEIAVIAINKVLRNKKEIIETIENVIFKIGDVSNLNKKKIKYEQELKVITELTEEHINKNKTTLQNQKEYNDKYDELVRQYDETKSKYDLLVEEISVDLARRKSLEKYVSDLKKQKTLIKIFDEMLFAGFIDYIEVYKDKKVVIFKDGKKIEI